NVLKDMVHGAGQVRTNGRYSIYFNENAIIEAVLNKINDITDITISDNSNFTPKGSGIEINFVFSIAGGTGSGSFMDVAYLVKIALAGNEEVTSTGFIVLPDVFNAMQQGVSMLSTKPNSYGALMDLDYLMQNNVENLGLSINFSNRIIEIDSNPFDIVFTVNNKNASGETINHIDDISEQIGLAMFTGASELSANVGSVYDNIKSLLVDKELDIEDKRAWACGMGVSELFYDGNTLGNIYARRVTAAMIDNLLNNNEDAQKLADVFIDDPAVSIRENEGNDFLIDSLLSSTPNYQFSGLDDLQDGKNVIQAYLKNVESTAEETIAENYNLRLGSVTSNLQNEVNIIINKDNGVGNAKAFLNDLKGQLLIFQEEMDSEEAIFKISQAQLSNQIQNDLNQLQNISSGIGFYLKRGEIKNSKQSISDIANQQGINIHEIFRRQFAKNFFNSLIRKVDEHTESLEIIEQRLRNVRQDAIGRANSLANSATSRNKIFVIDLHKHDLNKAYASHTDYLIKDLIESLNLSNSIYDFHQSSEEIISNYFWNYSRRLPKAMDFRNKSIEEVLADLPQEQQNEIARKLLNKSKALWQWSSEGYKVDHQISEDFVIGLKGSNNEFKKAFEGLTDAGNSNIEFVNTGVSNKITCYRMEAAVPVFGVKGIKEYENEYNLRKKRASSMNYHIDNNWLTNMKRENFSLWPLIKEDKSLSLWVFGFVYNFIRLNDNGNYEVYSLRQGDPLEGYWYELSEYRDSAFEKFKKEGFAEELEELVNKRQNEDGEIRTREIANSIKVDYRNQYAQLNISTEDLKKAHFKKIADLIRSEINFTTIELY
ncbi:MAG: tubulin-like doman-containing protein, partial [Ginsengibacter sp.]